jgi:arabinogalactan endo-1,4-beta-galactosidase
MKIRKFFALAAVVLGLAAPSQAQTFYICSQGDVETTTELNFSDGGYTLNDIDVADIDSITPHVPALHYVGGDISLLTKYEEKGANFLDMDGESIPDMLTFLKEQGLNTMRVRLFVDPSNAPADAVEQGVCQDLDFVADLGRRIKEAGLLFMLDFHYSDTWADPGAQWTPAAWATLNDAELQTKVYEYTRDCLEQLNDAGASPDFIQTGNEISYGMLWGTKAAVGSNSTNRCYSNSSDANWNRFFRLLRQAGKACREVCPRAKIIIHSERTPNPSVLVDYFKRLNNAAIDYDIIGLSYYPYHHGSLGILNSAIAIVENNFPNREIMLVETGFYHKWWPEKVSDKNPNGVKYDSSVTPYPVSNEGQRQFAEALINQIKQHSKVTGLVWWWLEANEKGINWQNPVTKDWYNAGLFDNETGRALPALYELQNFK